jgi:hypothetical protein
MDGNESLRFGMTYLEAILLLIPKLLWNARPMDLSENFALQHISNWSEGSGMGYSFLAEAYLNFSWFGAFLQYFIIGLLWGLVWKKIRRILWCYGCDGWYALYYILGFYFLIIMHRAPFSGLLKGFLQYAIAFGVFTLLVDQNVITRAIHKETNQFQ